MVKESYEALQLRIQELEIRLEESEQLIEAIKAGEVDAFAINSQDAPEIYTLQSGDHVYKVLIEEFGEGALTVTSDGLVVYTNASFCELLQVPYEKVVGAYIRDFIAPDSMAAFDEAFQNSLSGRGRGEINLHTHGHVVPVYMSLTSLQPKLDTIGVIITDFTDKKKNEELILSYQKDLEQKNQELVNTNAELASFTYIASHDLQEPLRKIQTFANRIGDKEAEHLSAHGLDYFKRLKAAARRMQTLIEDLLSYSRTNTQERIFEDVNLGKLLEEVKRDLREELQEKNAVIEATRMCHAHVIPFQFRQLLMNLISNSLKFAREETPPHIQVSSEWVKGHDLQKAGLAKEEKYCHIRISDNGIGFEQEYSQKIFELFQRLHGRTEYEGTGIGLAIVKKIVENHNGIISAHSSIGEGATFDIYIPTAQ